MSLERYARLLPYQKVNHFLAMSTLSCKRSLGQNLYRMKSVFEEDYGFFPETWELPEDLERLKQHFAQNRQSTYIMKPANSARGQGIFLTRNLTKIAAE
jgi:tubulin polyglutamylase TTLL6/13